MIEDAIVQGAVSGGITGVTIILLIRYILPKLDKIEDKLTISCEKLNTIFNFLIK